MPRTRRRRARAPRELFDHRDLMALRIGPPGRLRHPDRWPAELERLRALWPAVRDRLMAEASPGSRPWGWFAFAPGVPDAFRDYHPNATAADAWLRTQIARAELRALEEEERRQAALTTRPVTAEEIDDAT